MAKSKERPAEDALRAQGEASVRFGRMALRSDDLGAILTEACRLTGAALGTDLAKIMELQDDGRTLLVVAGVGWADGVVGEERIPALETSSEGYALATGAPTVSADINAEDRFDYADFLIRHDVHAMVNVIIPGPDGEPAYGLLQVDSKEPREFSESDIEFLQGYANLVGAAIERHYYQRRLREALDTQARLYAELQHRVKNNLAVISGLLQLKAGRAAHPVSKRDISEVMQQVDVLRELYDQLYASSDVDRVDLSGYIAAVCNNVASFQADGTRIRVEHDHVAVLVSPDLAVTLGMVANEFVTNSIKHAGSEKLKISTVIRREDGALRLSLADNGPGLGDALEHKGEATTGSGLELVEGMLGYAGCDWEWEAHASTKLHVSVPLYETLVQRD